MNLKKILFFSFLIIFIPFIIVNIFIREDEIKFNFNSNTIVRVYRESSGQVIKIPLEEYIIGVVSAEMPASFSDEALKAQSVASRTYVLHKIVHNKDKEYDVYDSVSSQVYLSEEELKEKWQDSYVENINKVKLSVLQTLGEYLTYGGEIIESFFFSTSTGYTENSEDVFSEKLPYLRSVQSKWDQKSPVFIDQKKMTKSTFLSALNLNNIDKIEVTVLSKTTTGRVKKIKINGVEFSGKDVCSKLDLRSTFFEITQNEDTVVINTKGYGHGVGMSQYGANGMALSGYKYDEILKYYYQGVKIEKLKK